MRRILAEPGVLLRGTGYLHIDVAFPLNATPDIKKVQLLVKGKASF
jgi:hypothetical protein